VAGVAEALIDKDYIMPSFRLEQPSPGLSRGFTMLLSIAMAKRIRTSNLQKLVATTAVSRRPLEARCFSVLNRPPPNYEGHIPLTVTERLGLALGSGLGSFLDPRRGGK
jgi:hypothetical protein